MANILGQAFMIGIEGTQLRAEEAEFIKNNNIGGVILFAQNYEAPAQVAELINEIQKCRDEYPLFISVDQEGGRVQRFKNGFTLFPPMEVVGSWDSPKSTYEVHLMLGEELRAVGVNLDFSPVCDVWSNPLNKVIADRAFGTTSEVVEKHVSAAIRGLHAADILACAKHFPGHGSTKKDSHLDLPYVTLTRDEWEALELPPFRKAAKSKTDMMMMAHLVVDIFDREKPCTLSLHAYEALRSLLKFNKVIITDELEMNAIKDHFGILDSTIMALQAGADIVLYRNFSVAAECFEAAQKAYAGKKISSISMQQKHERIINLKKEKLSNFKQVIVHDLSKNMKVEAHRQALQKLLDQYTQK